MLDPKVVEEIRDGLTRGRIPIQPVSLADICADWRAMYEALRWRKCNEEMPPEWVTVIAALDDGDIETFVRGVHMDDDWWLEHVIGWRPVGPPPAE